MAGFLARLFAGSGSVGDMVAKAVVAGDAEPFATLSLLGSNGQRMQALEKAARDLMLDEAFDAAAVVLDHAATLDPSLLNERRVALAQIRGRPEDELPLLLAAVKAHPADPGPRQRAVVLLLAFGRGAEALLLLDRAPHEDLGLKTLRPRVLLAAGKREAARALARELLPAARADADGALKEGEAEVSTGNAERRVIELESVLAAIEGGVR